MSDLKKSLCDCKFVCVVVGCFFSPAMLVSLVRHSLPLHTLRFIYSMCAVICLFMYLFLSIVCIPV